jgi:hypothetical protein
VHWQSDALTTRLDLIANKREINDFDLSDLFGLIYEGAIGQQR